LRPGEICEVTWQQMVFFTDHVEIFVAHSKTDQHWDGAWVVILAASTEQLSAGAVCPVAVLTRLLELGDYESVDAGLAASKLIRGVSATPRRERSHCLRRSGIAVSRMTELMREAFAEAGVAPETVTGHILRISGATESGRADTPDRLTQRQGRWRSERMQRQYTRDGRPVQMTVTSGMMALLQRTEELPSFE
jgi:hypothetical protein